MAKSALKLSGVPGVRKAFQQARARAQKAMLAATAEALRFLEAKAQENLEAGIYQKAREPFAPPLTYDLLRAFVHLVQSVGTGGLMGELVNTDPVAGFIELGTDDEGTGQHFVPASADGVLHFINPMTGESVFSKGHFVHGIHPLHFMERALTEHKGEVVAIYRRHLSGVFG